MRLFYRLSRIFSEPNVVVVRTPPAGVLMVTWGQMRQHGVYLADSSPERVLEIAQFLRAFPANDWFATGQDQGPRRAPAFFLELAGHIAPATLFIEESWVKDFCPDLAQKLAQKGVRVRVQIPDESDSRSAA